MILAPLLLPALAACAAGVPDYGILLMAHGGEASWNREVLAIGKELGRRAPTEVAFGMADAEQLKGALARLARSRARRIVAVPLFVNSASEVMDQTRFVLGLRDTPSEVLRAGLERMARGNAHGAASGAGPHHHHDFSFERVESPAPLVMTPALDDHPLVEGVLLERLRALSREPARETLILVGHGPVDDGADAFWLATMGRLAVRLKDRAGLKAARALTLRDDAYGPVREEAVRRLRAAVAAAGEGGGRVVVVPYLVARGGIEEHIVSALAGLDYAWDGKTLCPHPDIARWAAETAAAAGAPKEKP